jgi:hypothetical protein
MKKENNRCLNQITGMLELSSNGFRVVIIKMLQGAISNILGKKYKNRMPQQSIGKSHQRNRRCKLPSGISRSEKCNN